MTIPYATPTREPRRPSWLPDDIGLCSTVPGRSEALCSLDGTRLLDPHILRVYVTEEEAWAFLRGETRVPGGPPIVRFWTR